MAGTMGAVEARAPRLRWVAAVTAMLVTAGFAAISVSAAGATAPVWDVTSTYVPDGDGYALVVAGTLPPSCSDADAYVLVALDPGDLEETAEIEPSGGPFQVTFAGLDTAGGHTVTIAVIDGPPPCEPPAPFTTPAGPTTPEEPVIGDPLAWDDDDLPSTATVDAPYGDEVLASGGTGEITYTVRAGALPLGLVLGPDGTVSGTPTRAETASFSIEAEDADGATIDADFTIEVLAAAVLPGGVVNPGTVNPSTPTPNPTPAPRPTPAPAPITPPAAPAAPNPAVQPTAAAAPAAPAAAVVQSGTLARTGTSTGPLAAMGALLVIAGASLHTAGRRQAARA